MHLHELCSLYLLTIQMHSYVKMRLPRQHVELYDRSDIWVCVSEGNHSLKK